MKGDAAVIYARVSTARQETKGLSIPGQVERCGDAASQAGFRVARVFREAESASEDAEKRPVFQEAVAFALDKDNGISAFIVYDTSRFARRREDAVVYKTILRRKGVRIIYVMQNIDEDRDEDLFIEGIYELMDERYSRVLSKLVLRGMIDNAKKGHFNGGVCPVGYRWERIATSDARQKSTLAVDPATAPIVRRMFSLVLSGHGCIDIARTLNAEGIRSPRGKAWSNTMVHKVLSSRKYIGDFEFETRGEKVIAEGTHQAIIDRGTWERTQEMLAARSPFRGKERQRRINPHRHVKFSGLLFCAVCGSAMVATTGKSKTGKIYRYYECSNARKVGTCNGHRIRAEEFDEMTIGLLSDYVFIEENLQRSADALISWARETNGHIEGQRAEARKQIDEVNTRLSRLYRAIEDGCAAADLAPRLAELARAKRELEMEMTNLVEIPLPVITHVQRTQAVGFVRGLIVDATPEELARFLQRLDFRIEIGPDRAVKITANPALVISHSAQEFAENKIWRANAARIANISWERRESVRVLCANLHLSPSGTPTRP